MFPTSAPTSFWQPLIPTHDALGAALLSPINQDTFASIFAELFPSPRSPIDPAISSLLPQFDGFQDTIGRGWECSDSPAVRSDTFTPVVSTCQSTFADNSFVAEDDSSCPAPDLSNWKYAARYPVFVVPPSSTSPPLSQTLAVCPPSLTASPPNHATTDANSYTSVRLADIPSLCTPLLSPKQSPSTIAAGILCGFNRTASSCLDLFEISKFTTQPLAQTIMTESILTSPAASLTQTATTSEPTPKPLAAAKRRSKRSTQHSITCEDCGRGFARTDLFAIHQFHHRPYESRPFPCELCPLRFCRHHDYLRHKASLHSDAREHTCRRCGASFARTDALFRHKVSCQKAAVAGTGRRRRVKAQEEGLEI
ncbi:hypothetical protein DFJ73DRAFT_966626 [Zopfochytrium polystomum]|nr:hypothetical protein DFJ73DRAFT_966626 [Zopfochytrium polystomum]